MKHDDGKFESAMKVVRREYDYAMERHPEFAMSVYQAVSLVTEILRYYIHAYAGLQTSIYTKRPASMKYRGPFKKLERKDDKPGKLTYIAEFTKFSIRECFEKWKKRQPLS